MSPLEGMGESKGNEGKQERTQDRARANTLSGSDVRERERERER